MKWYIFCILMFALLFLGLSKTTANKMQGFQSSIEVLRLDNQRCIRVDCVVSSAAFDTKIKDDYHSLSCNKPLGYNTCDGVSFPFSFSRYPSTSRNLKFDHSSYVIRTLSVLTTLLPENKCKSLPSNTLFLKYSYGYYIYTLSRILI